MRRLTRRRDGRIIKLVKSPSRSLAGLFVLFQAFATSASVCASWQASAEARVACCQDETSCPMHATTPHRHTAPSRVSQADADNCCASAERSTSTPSTLSDVPRIALGALASPIPAVGPAVAAFRESPTARTSVDVSPVPRHLLLSIFLI